MRFEIETDRGQLVYETDPCSITDAAGNRIDMSKFGMPYLDGEHAEDQIAFSPDRPLQGKSQPRVLKIQMGLGCNYSCSYCSQGGQKAELTSNADAAVFLAGLDAWLTEAPEKIELWGGEPLLYWRKVEILAPALRERFPAAKLSMVTNGTLLTLERAQFLYQLGFSLSVSHDGPGQDLRGEDPFEDPTWRNMIRTVFVLFGTDRICFNAVLTRMNYNLLDLATWFERRIGFPVKVNIEDVVTDYGGAEWSEAELVAMAGNVRHAIGEGWGLSFPRMMWAVLQLLQTLSTSKRLDGSYQVCQMDRPDYLAVDLAGNVLTCQNVGAESGHKVGAVDDLAGVSIGTSTSWAARPNCRACPVVHLCYGSCMFLSEKDFASSCRASYHYNLAILFGVIELLTGAKATAISGWKPKPPLKTIAIKAVA